MWTNATPMYVSFLFCRHSTAFRVRNLTTIKGTAGRGSHTTPDAVKLAGKGIVADELLSQLVLKKKLLIQLNKNLKMQWTKCQSWMTCFDGKVTIITLLLQILLFVPADENNINSRWKLKLVSTRLMNFFKLLSVTSFRSVFPFLDQSNTKLVREPVTPK